MSGTTRVVGQGRRRPRLRTGWPRRPTISLLVLLPALSALALLWAAIGSKPPAYPSHAAPETAALFRPCTVGAPTCVVDGDTLRIDGTPIRIADIDAPESRDYRCPEELALARAAESRLLELVNQGPFALEMGDGRDADIYGRKLRVLTRDGHSLGMILVAEGLARPWEGARRSWCG